MSCLCTDDDALECCGGLPRTAWGECSCSCHVPRPRARMRLVECAPAERFRREGAEDRGPARRGAP